MSRFTKVAAAAVLPLAALALSLCAAGRVAAQQAPAALSARIEPLILSPEPGERILQDGALVAVSFIDRDQQLDPGSIRLTVDGIDVTPEAQVSAEVVTWVPRANLEPGPHRASLTARARDGSSVSPVSWAFTVAPGFEASPNAERLRNAPTSFDRMQGSVTLEGSTLSVSGAGSAFRRDESALPRMWASVGGLLGGGFRYSANVHLSGYESAERQPVNRFRVDIRSDHLSLAVGDVNPSLQDLMLSGARVRGVQGTVKGKGLGLTVVNGRTKRAIDGLLDATGLNVLRPGTFGQNLLAVRPTFGSHTFLFGLTALHVKDDVASIAELRTGGTANRSVNPTPKENLVVGADATVNLLDNRVLLQYQSAFSLLANDISSGPLTEAQLDSIMDAADYDRLGVDPSDYEDYFTLNASLIPLDPRGLTSLAQTASASVRTGTNILSAEWRSIGGSYYSLGYNALVRDREGIRIRDSFSTLRNALNLAAGFETDKDNVDDVKPATTTQTGIFATANWQASQTSPTVVASVRQGARKNDLARGQSGALDETNRAVSLGLGIPVGEVMGLETRVNLNVSAVNRDDPSNPSVESKDRYFLGGFQAQDAERTRQFQLMYGLNRSELQQIADAKTDFHRVVGNARYLVAPRYTATFEGTYTAARSPQSTTLSTLYYNRGEFLLGGEFEWTAASFISLTAGLTTYSNVRSPNENTNEIVTRIRVHRAF
jgi:hypothetical protein